MPQQLNPDFGWSEVDCFLRPQAIVCNNTKEHLGLLFVFLASLHRTWGRGEHSVADADRDFAFARRVLTPLLALDFERASSPDADLGPAIKNALALGCSVIVPANLRLLPHYRFFGQRDQAHYFIVVGFDELRRLTVVRDNLHLTSDNQSTSYGLHAMPTDLMQSLIASYTASASAESAAKDRWFLKICPRLNSRNLRPPLQTVLAEYVKMEHLVSDGAGSSNHVDKRYLEVLRRCRDSGRRDEVIRQARWYLEQCHFSSVHLKAAAFAALAIHDRNGSPTFSLQGVVTEYQREAFAVRNALLVKLLSGADIPDSEWKAVGGRLLDLAIGVARRFGRILLPLTDHETTAPQTGEGFDHGKP